MGRDWRPTAKMKTKAESFRVTCFRGLGGFLKFHSKEKKALF